MTEAPAEAEAAAEEVRYIILPAAEAMAEAAENSKKRVYGMSER